MAKAPTKDPADQLAESPDEQTPADNDNEAAASVAAGEEGEQVASEEGDEFIRFSGHLGVREISKEDWAAIGIDGQDDVRWDRVNGHRVPRSEFNAKALNYLLHVDGEFTAEEA